MSQQPQHTPTIVLFDGVCNYCNGLVNFLLRQDRNRKLRFAALQSAAGKRVLASHGLSLDYLDSFVLIDKGRALTRSTAALILYNRLPWYWKWTQIFWVFPRFIRDAVYNFFARNRYRWFGKREQCMVPSPEVKQRFLDDE